MRLSESGLRAGGALVARLAHLVAVVEHSASIEIERVIREFVTLGVHRLLDGAVARLGDLL